MNAAIFNIINQMSQYLSAEQLRELPAIFYIRSMNERTQYIHTGPVIRRESFFENYTLDDRRKLIYKILNFYNKCSINHDTVVVNRKEAPDKSTLSGRLAKLYLVIFAWL